jgi:hypothetical protein
VSESVSGWVSDIVSQSVSQSVSESVSHSGSELVAATTHQVVQQRHDEVLARAHGAVVVSLEGADGVVAVAGAPALLVQAGHEAEGVVGEEAAVVERHGQQLRGGASAHHLVVSVLVSARGGKERRREGE